MKELEIQKVDDRVQKANETLFRLIEELNSYGFDVTTILVTPLSLAEYMKMENVNAPFTINMENHPITYELRTARRNIRIGVKP